jgi:CheY-like chemotaxis protein
VKPPSRGMIVVIGSDLLLTYLVERYAEQSGHDVALMQTAPSSEEVCSLRPVAILFPSLERLEAAQPLIADLANCDIPILVCSSTTDAARARELGADHCLLHPLTYDGFLAALPAARASSGTTSTV